MIKEILLREINEQILSFKSLIAFVVIMVLFVVNGFIFIMNYQERLTEYENVRSQTESAIADGVASFRTLVRVRQQHIKPPSKLFFISTAEEKNLPNAAIFDCFRLEIPGYIKKQNPLFSTFGTIDWTNILLVFMSFICISFAYNAFSGEKVTGTLRLVLSNRVTRWQIITGKWLGILAIVLIPLIIGFLLNLLIIIISGIDLSGRDFVVIFYFLLVAIFFLSFNILLGFLVSALTLRPVISLSISLIVWVILNIAVPSISWLMAKELTPIQSLAKIHATHNEKSNELLNSDRYYAGWREECWDKPPNELALKRAAWIDALDELYAETWMDYVNNVFAQTRKGINVSKISPYSLFRFIGETISDNGFSGFVRFYNQARRYHDEYNQFLKDKDQADKDSYHLVVNEGWTFNTFMSNKPVEYNEIPVFQYESPGIRDTIHDTLPDVMILVLWNIFLFAGSFFAFVKYDVR
jgi:ABC-type transport system involved in multi-copper enzyme maturation permease subunit